MPIVQYSSCERCRGMTWHEYVADSVTGTGVWICRDCGDRRAAERFSLGPEAARQLGKIQTDTLISEVAVLDISVLGARLQVLAPGDHMPEKGDGLLFNPRLQPVGPLGVYHRARVRWVDGAVCGVAFAQALLACAADLKRIVKA